MRKALIVGIDHYSSTQVPSLYGCVNDAYSVKSVLERNSDGTTNFTNPKLLTATGDADTVSREDIIDNVRELFSGDDEIALFYFAGHGYIEDTGGYILASDSTRGDAGVSLASIVSLANASNVRNKIIVLDSCHSGCAGEMPSSDQQISHLSEGLTILTASTKDQYASEENGHGVFTSLFVDALNGAASNLVGDITPGSVYAHIDQSLGPWGQRPVFKTNIKKFVSLRKVQPSITLKDLQRITEFFPHAGYEFQLDPSFEPERSAASEGDEAILAPDPKNNEIFGILQKYNRVDLLVPIGAPHMWHAAMHSKSCKLTVKGEHYRELVQKKLL